jgi:hypothetical protein
MVLGVTPERIPSASSHPPKGSPHRPGSVGAFLCAVGAGRTGMLCLKCNPFSKYDPPRLPKGFEPEKE